MPESLDVLLIDNIPEKKASRLKPALKGAAEEASVHLLSATGTEEGLQLLARYGGLIDAVLFCPNENRPDVRRIETLYPTLPALTLPPDLVGAGDAASLLPEVRAVFTQLRRIAGEKDDEAGSTAPSSSPQKGAPFVLVESDGDAPGPEYAAYFAFRLDRLAAPRSEAEEANAIQVALGWHRRLLSTLAVCARRSTSADTNVRFHLRYASNQSPDHPTPHHSSDADANPFEIAIVAVVEASEKRRARRHAGTLQSELQVHLGAHPRTGASVYHFEPVCTETALRRLLLPFRPQAAARVTPRTRTVLFPAALFALTRLAISEDASGPIELPLLSSGGEAHRSLRPLCALMARHRTPALIDGVLRPAPLDPADEDRLRALAHLPTLREAADAFPALCDLDLTPGAETTLAARAEALLKAPADGFDMRLFLAQDAATLSPSLQAAAVEGFFGGDSAATTKPAYAETRRGMLRLFAPSDTSRGTLASCYPAHEVAEQFFRLPLPLEGTTPGVPSTHPAREHHPEGLAGEGPVLGVKKTGSEDPLVRLAPDDLRRHVYILGQTGTGKTTMLHSMIRERMEVGAGVGLIDPHGDLWEDVKNTVPAGREDDVVTFDPADPQCPVRLNLLEHDPARPEERSMLIEEMFSIFRQEYDPGETMGPIFETYMRNAMLLVMDAPRCAPGTLLDVVKVFRDDEYRERRLRLCQNDLVVDFWENEAQQVSSGSDHSLRNITPYVTSKLNAFLYNDYLRRLISAHRSTINFREILDEGKILLVRLSKGRLGAFGVRLFGTVLFARLLMAALAREDVPEEQRRDFFLFVDEFQHFTSQATASMLTEARKYRLGLTLANQALGQLRPGIRQTLLGSVGNLIVLRPGVEDYPHVAPYVAPPFTREDILGLPNFSGVARLLVEGAPAEPFLFQTCDPRDVQ